MGTLKVRTGPTSWAVVGGQGPPGEGGITQAAADIRYVNVNGDTMTGSLATNVAGNFHGLRLQNANNTPFLEFRSNDATPTRYSFVQGSAALTHMQADVGDIKMRSLVGKTILQSPVSVDAEMGDAAGARFRIMNNGFEKAWIDKDGAASFYTTRCSGAFTSNALTLDGLFAADLTFTSARYSATGPPGSQIRGVIAVDGDENMIFRTENLASGTGDVIFRLRGTDKFRINGDTGELYGGFITATPVFATNWEDNLGNFSPMKLVKFGPLVFCQGLVKRSTGAPAFTTGLVATVPVGYRPTAGSMMYNQMTNTGVVARLDVTAAGAITVSGSPAVTINAGGWVTLQMVWTTE